MSRTFTNNSCFILLLRSMSIKYRALEETLYGLCKDSRTHRLITELIYNFRNYLKFSFIGKISEIKKREDTKFLEISITLKWLNNFYKKSKTDFNIFLNNSKIHNSAIQLKEQFYSSPLKIISIIVIIAVVTNIILSILFKIRISLFGWVMRSLLLFGGFTGLNSGMDWVTVKSNSIILGLFFKK